jgi:16S rRNA U516 pseudouridylate synthase RsuA-like enzyme
MKRRKYRVMIGHPHFSEERMYRVQAKSEVEAARIALTRPGVSKCGYEDFWYEEGKRDGEACTRFTIDVLPA